MPFDRQIEKRREDLIRLYLISENLKQTIGGARQLADCSGGMAWPKRGVYFFYEEGENRSDTGSGSRLVRVGTNALTASSQTTLWNRLSQHKGSAKTGSGNHQGSIFRLLVGDALISRDKMHCRTWLQKSVSEDERATELPAEREVSKYIGKMWLLWLPVEDDPGLRVCAADLSYATRRGG